MEGLREAELTAGNPRETTTGEVGGEQGVNQEQRGQAPSATGGKKTFADEGEDRRPKQESTQMWEQCEGQYWQPTACDMSFQGAMV